MLLEQMIVMKWLATPIFRCLIPGWALVRFTQVAFVYRNGVMVDLNNLIGEAVKRYQLYSAISAVELPQPSSVARAAPLSKHSF
jgi:hypothetical protein